MLPRLKTQNFGRESFYDVSNVPIKLGTRVCSTVTESWEFNVWEKVMDTFKRCYRRFNWFSEVLRASPSRRGGVLRVVTQMRDLSYFWTEALNMGLKVFC